MNNPESIALVERALAADPRQPKALALAGTAAYDRADYAGAIARWQSLADGLGPGSELAPRVQAMIADAREHLGGAGAAAIPARGAASTAAPSAAADRVAAAPRPPASGAADTGRVSGTVTLDPALAGQAAPDDSVFVFARAATGSRMPLAVRRAQVKDLPLAFTLDDSMAMAPGATLSSVPQLIVGARISKSGNAIPQAGDLAGEATGVKPGAKTWRSGSAASSAGPEAERASSEAGAQSKPAPLGAPSMPRLPSNRSRAATSSLRSSSRSSGWNRSVSTTNTGAPSYDAKKSASASHSRSR